MKKFELSNIKAGQVLVLLNKYIELNDYLGEKGFAGTGAEYTEMAKAIIAEIERQDEEQ